MYIAFSSIIVVNVGWLYVINVGTVDPRFLTWAMSMKCACASCVCHRPVTLSKYQGYVDGKEYSLLLMEIGSHVMNIFISFSRSPLATFHDSKHTISYMALNPTKKMLLTVGGDKVVKVNK